MRFPSPSRSDRVTRRRRYRRPAGAPGSTTARLGRVHPRFAAATATPARRDDTRCPPGGEAGGDPRKRQRVIQRLDMRAIAVIFAALAKAVVDGAQIGIP
jgi:hypothetical protein